MAEVFNLVKALKSEMTRQASAPTIPSPTSHDVSMSPLAVDGFGAGVDNDNKVLFVLGVSRLGGQAVLGGQA